MSRGSEEVGMEAFEKFQILLTFLCPHSNLVVLESIIVSLPSSQGHSQVWQNWEPQDQMTSKSPSGSGGPWGEATSIDWALGHSPGLTISSLFLSQVAGPLGSSTTKDSNFGMEEPLTGKNILNFQKWALLLPCRFFSQRALRPSLLDTGSPAALRCL